MRKKKKKYACYLSSLVTCSLIAARRVFHIGISSKNYLRENETHVEVKKRTLGLHNELSLSF